MRTNLSTHTNETFTTNSGMTVRYEPFFTGIGKEVQRYGYRGGKDLRKEDLEDLQQDACKKIIVSKGSYDPAKSHDCPEAYGHMTVLRLEHDAYTRAAKRASIFTPFEAEDEDGEEYVSYEISGYRGDEFEADRELTSKEVISYIYGKVATLEKGQREVVELAMKGYKTHEISKTLGITPNAVSSRLSRGKKQLAIALGARFMKEHVSGYKLCA